MTRKKPRIFRINPTPVAGWIALCILVYEAGTLLQAQAPAEPTVTGAFASTVVPTNSYVQYQEAVENATKGNLAVKNSDETQGAVIGKTYDGTLRLPEAKDGQAWICLMTLVSDDGCTMSIDNAVPWLDEYGKGHDISKGARPWSGLFVSGKTYDIKIYYSQVWYKPNIGDLDGISVILCLTPVDLEEVISDQIAGNDANKLPTAFFKGEPNNPMLMATRSAQKAKLRVKMAGIDPKIYVGARKVGASTVLGSTSATANPVPLEFDVPATSHDIYEIVAGYDANSNSTLDNAEVVVVFKKTPLKDSAGATATDPQNLLDKIIIVDQGQFTSSKSTIIGYNIIGSGYAGDLIEGFARGRKTIPSATMTPSITISSTQPGLSHPVGAKWNVANQDTTYRFTFPDGSPASNDTKASNALKEIVQKVINDNKAAMISAYTGTPEWPVSPYYDFNEGRNFGTTESFTGTPGFLGFRLSKAFGKVTLQGKLRISYKKTGATTIQVGSVEVIAAFEDLYDFAYGGGDQAREASMVQSGHATLAGATEPDGGKVFFTKVEFNTGFANTWNGTY